MNCVHVYKNVNAGICPHCGKMTHEVDWDLQTKLEAQWRLDNPNAKYGGWMSI